MRVLVVTAMYPTAENPAQGVFVQEQVESLRRLGVEVDTFLVRGKARLKYPVSIPAIRRRLRERRYDLVHAHHVYAGAVAACAPGAPLVTTFHGAEISGRSRALGALSRWVAGRSRASVVVSSEMKSLLGVESADVIPCGVDLRLFHPRGREACRRLLGLPVEPRLVLFAGHFDGRPRRVKRLDLAEEAVRRARNRLPAMELWPVSRVPHERMPVHIGAADAVVLTSDAEGSPMIVKESLAMGIPVVSVPVGDVPEIARRCRLVHLRPRDPEALAEGLIRACESGGRKGPPDLPEALSLESVAARLLSVYARAADGRRPS